MELNKEELNERLFNSAAHVAEAAKIISDVDKTFALSLYAISDKILSIIVPEKEYLKKEKIDSIMDEIFGADNGDL